MLLNTCGRWNSEVAETSSTGQNYDNSEAHVQSLAQRSSLDPVSHIRAVCPDWRVVVAGSDCGGGRRVVCSLHPAALCSERGLAVHSEGFAPQVVHMGWVSERLGGAGSSQTFRPRFLALKGSSCYIFVSPPVSGPLGLGGMLRRPLSKRRRVRPSIWKWSGGCAAGQPPAPRPLMGRTLLSSLISRPRFPSFQAATET